MEKQTAPPPANNTRSWILAEPTPTKSGRGLGQGGRCTLWTWALAPMDTSRISSSHPRMRSLVTPPMSRKVFSEQEIKDAPNLAYVDAPSHRLNSVVFFLQTMNGYPFRQSRVHTQTSSRMVLSSEIPPIKIPVCGPSLLPADRMLNLLMLAPKRGAGTSSAWVDPAHGTLHQDCFFRSKSRKSSRTVLASHFPP
ncbi:hypothetical protein MPH_06057 [Macrophomina phaseolina MS6]|uniref:Uncharacterized protein n=1 Tax=Macrophomina phaseolina (strain MS6) TaxID=1126212 RepID=K2R339_MACPH|nr:hypothetical protein MPH_06057 [Macrophomina phaseolina MS6]